MLSSAPKPPRRAGVRQGLSSAMPPTISSSPPAWLRLRPSRSTTSPSTAASSTEPPTITGVPTEAGTPRLNTTNVRISASPTLSPASAASPSPRPDTASGCPCSLRRTSHAAPSPAATSCNTTAPTAGGKCSAASLIKKLYPARHSAVSRARGSQLDMG
jgi:hypothetical protein